MCRLVGSSGCGSRGNGSAEAGVKAVKDRVRLLLALSLVEITCSYLVRYCGSMISRCAREPDGRTAFERRKGRVMERGLPPFAEVVLYRVPKTTKPPARVEERRLKGIFVGVRDDTDVVFILNERGLLTARSVKRVEAGSRYNKELLARCTARPWERFVRPNPRSVSGDACHRWAASGSTGHSQATPFPQRGAFDAWLHRRMSWLYCCSR